MSLLTGVTQISSCHHIKTIIQLCLYIGLYLFSEWVVKIFNIPLPPNLIGMLIMLSLLMSSLIPSQWCRSGADFLLAEMMLFFVPTVVAIIKYIPLLIDVGGRVFGVISLSSLMVFGATAWVVDKIYHFEIARLRNEK